MGWYTEHTSMAQGPKILQGPISTTRRIILGALAGVGVVEDVGTKSYLFFVVWVRGSVADGYCSAFLCLWSGRFLVG